VIGLFALILCFCDIAVVYASEALSQQQQPIESCILLKTFLLLWKRLEMLKQHWFSTRFDVSSVQTHKQYVSYWLVFGFSISFYLFVAQAWNSLPISVTASTSLPSFKRQLKTFLFTKSFPSL